MAQRRSPHISWACGRTKSASFLILRRSTFNLVVCMACGKSAFVGHMRQQQRTTTSPRLKWGCREIIVQKNPVPLHGADEARFAERRDVIEEADVEEGHLAKDQSIVHESGVRDRIVESTRIPQFRIGIGRAWGKPRGRRQPSAQFQSLCCDVATHRPRFEIGSP